MRSKELRPVVGELIPLRSGGAHHRLRWLSERSPGRTFPAPAQDRHQIAGHPVETEEGHEQQNQPDHSANHPKLDPPSQSRKEKTPKHQEEQSEKPDDARREVPILALPPIELPHPNHRARRQCQDGRNRPPAHRPQGRSFSRMVSALVGRLGHAKRLVRFEVTVNPLLTTNPWRMRRSPTVRVATLSFELGFEYTVAMPISVALSRRKCDHHYRHLKTDEVAEGALQSQGFGGEGAEGGDGAGVLVH